MADKPQAYWDACISYATLMGADILCTNMTPLGFSEQPAWFCRGRVLGVGMHDTAGHVAESFLSVIGYWVVLTNDQYELVRI